MSALPPSFANSTTPCFASPAAYGSFSSTQTQVAGAVSATPVVYDTADITPFGVSCTLPSANIVIGIAGVYKVLASAQCDKTGAGLATPLDMWVSVNGTAVPNSATRIAVNQNSETVMTVEWFLDLDKGDTVAVQTFSSSGALDLQLLAVPAAAPVPAIPSIITTLLRIA
jgi:hypothetical protein